MCQFANYYGQTTIFHHHVVNFHFCADDTVMKCDISGSFFCLVGIRSFNVSNSGASEHWQMELLVDWFLKFAKKCQSYFSNF